MFFIAYHFKGQVHVFAALVKIVSDSSCRTSAILKYFCPLILITHSFLQVCNNHCQIAFLKCWELVALQVRSKGELAFQSAFKAIYWNVYVK